MLRYVIAAVMIGMLVVTGCGKKAAPGASPTPINTKAMTPARTNAPARATPSGEGISEAPFTLPGLVDANKPLTEAEVQKFIALYPEFAKLAGKSGRGGEPGLGLFPGAELFTGTKSEAAKRYLAEKGLTPEEFAGIGVRVILAMARARLEDTTDPGFAEHRKEIEAKLKDPKTSDDEKAKLKRELAGKNNKLAGEAAFGAPEESVDIVRRHMSELIKVMGLPASD